jgi:hypothetical protein
MNGPVHLHVPDADRPSRRFNNGFEFRPMWGLPPGRMLLREEMAALQVTFEKPSPAALFINGIPSTRLSGRRSRRSAGEADD